MTTAPKGHIRMRHPSDPNAQLSFGDRQDDGSFHIPANRTQEAETHGFVVAHHDPSQAREVGESDTEGEAGPQPKARGAKTAQGGPQTRGGKFEPQTQDKPGDKSGE